MNRKTYKKVPKRLLYGTAFAVSLCLFASTGFSNNLSAPRLGSATAQAQTSGMTLTQLEAILKAEDNNLQGSAGQWQLNVNVQNPEDPSLQATRPVVVLADQTNNRMRIVAPVAAASEMSAQQVQIVLLANFHTALDARYALSEDTLVSVFVHPLGSLSEDDLRSGLSQVATLADTFGTTYSSGIIGFGPGNQSNSQPASADDLPI